MLKLLSLFFLTVISLWSFEFKVTSYNVENLFDLKHDKTEYKEYIPNSTSNWNKKTQKQKINNIVRVIKDLNSDIIALQEIESQQALNDLLKYLPNYNYSAFIKNKHSSIGLAVISKFKIIKNKKLYVKNSKVNRAIQEVDIQIGSKPNGRILKLFNNHWASKRQKESQRVNFAMILQERIKQLSRSVDYILIGDFNSNYNEFETIKLDKKLNNTNSLTGINHVLNTIVDNNYTKKDQILNYKQRVHYNLWHEFTYEKRFSNKYRGQNTTPDNILLSPALFDNQNIAYINNSFKVYKPNYLYQNKKIIRWKINQKSKVHLGMGFSDHLPITATFTLKKYLKESTKKLTNIDDLYTVKSLVKPFLLHNVTVIYKHDNHAIIKNRNSRAIFLYNCANGLKLGYKYNLNILQIKEHYGLKEVVKIDIQREYNLNTNYKEFYKDFYTIDLDNFNHQNEIISNLKAKFLNGYLHYQNKKIKLYAKDKTLLPNNGQNVTIISGHLGFFKNRAQIIIYKKSDISAY